MNNDNILSSLTENIEHLLSNMKEIQQIKDKEYYIHFKNCGGCKAIQE